MPTTKNIERPPSSKPKSAHGGTRVGAGRKKGSGPLGETTKVMRVPASKAEGLKAWLLAQAEFENQVKEIDQLASNVSNTV
jgi:hypothetical protein